MLTDCRGLDLPSLASHRASIKTPGSPSLKLKVASSCALLAARLKFVCLIPQCCRPSLAKGLQSGSCIRA